MPNIIYTDAINNITYDFSVLNTNQQNTLIDETASKSVLLYNVMYQKYSSKSTFSQIYNYIAPEKMQILTQQRFNVSELLALRNNFVSPNITNSSFVSPLYSYKLIIGQELPTGRINF